MAKVYDFSGWATRHDVRCSDGKTIKKGAFKDNDGQTVPLVWNHGHNSPDDVLGHALLENRDEGVYAYCSFNNTPNGQEAKELVVHGDICSLSIYANILKRDGANVTHGAIREVSLVLAGANPGAKIESVVSHGDEQEVFQIYNCSEDLELYHAENNEKTDSKEDNKEEKLETVEDVVNTMNEKQKKVMFYLINAALDRKSDTAKHSEGESEETIKHSEETIKHSEETSDHSKENTEMKTNAFDNANVTNENTLSHSDLCEILKTAQNSSTGSLKKAFDDTVIAHSITNVENLFPEVRPVNNVPATVDRDQTWVSKVMAKVHRTPFSRVKSTLVDITADAARAKGYVKGNQKVEEVITALKRTTTPQTIYKLQKMDRDDLLDITDFDVVPFIKAEMRGKLEEELARAILIGDGRSALATDKINESNIRPIWTDTQNNLYTIRKEFEPVANETPEARAKRLIKLVIKSRKEYKGSGNPTFFTTEDVLSDMLLIEDKNERFIYETVDKLKTVLRVSDIVTVEPMETASRENAEGTHVYSPLGILVNLNDYNVGADKGGAVTMFDDFDINFNKYEYLIETRCSGALVKPKSAIVFEFKTEKPSEAAA